MALEVFFQVVNFLETWYFWSQVTGFSAKIDIIFLKPKNGIKTAISHTRNYPPFCHMYN